jgi:hypothetical protein
MAHQPSSSATQQYLLNLACSSGTASMPDQSRMYILKRLAPEGDRELETCTGIDVSAREAGLSVGLVKTATAMRHDMKQFNLLILLGRWCCSIPNMLAAVMHALGREQRQ